MIARCVSPRFAAASTTLSGLRKAVERRRRVAVQVDERFHRALPGIAEAARDADPTPITSI